ncbi:phosphate ABC transporter substrate-binding protein [Burkholderiaceae bacterium DAT-1]|nr:phosphate ABC transporter substrate-binding protein [Burkholderiaceae bacterium DAT-1]
MKKSLMTLLIAVLAPVCLAGDFVVVVGSKAAIDKLTGEQVSQIFLGKTGNFPNGTPAIPIDQQDGSPIREDFSAKVLGKSSIQIKAYWSKVIFTGRGQPPKEIAGSGEIKKLLSSNPNTISYIEKSAVDSSVKVVFSE